MGLEDEIDITDDIGTADIILASSSEMKQNSWIRGVAKFHQLPIFVIKVAPIASLFFNIVFIKYTSKLHQSHISIVYISQIPWHSWSRQFV